MQALPVALSMRGRHDRRLRGVQARASPLMAVDAELRLVTHRAVRGIAVGPALVDSRDELRGVVARNQLEPGWMALVTGLRRDLALALVFQTMTAVA